MQKLLRPSATAELRSAWTAEGGCPYASNFEQRLVVWYISLFTPTIGRDQSAHGNPENSCRNARDFADQVCCRTNSGGAGAGHADRHVLWSGGRPVQPARGGASVCKQIALTGHSDL